MLFDVPIAARFTSDLTSWTQSGNPALCPAAGVMSFLDEGPLPPTRFYRVVEVIVP